MSMKVLQIVQARETKTSEIAEFEADPHLPTPNWNL